MRVILMVLAMVVLSACREPPEDSCRYGGELERRIEECTKIPGCRISLSALETRDRWLRRCPGE